jgi:two-component system, sensor histidine kinase and response regulator
LIVDDVPENLQVLGSMLQRKGYDVNVASSGADALSFVAKQPPDLILLDVAMPQMDGFQVCEALKANPDTKHIPVMFLTAHSDKERIVHGFQSGGVDYITKPFHAAELMARVRTHLELKLSRELIEKRNDELQALNDEKNELLGIVAHDLKNPLNGIRGIAELLIKTDNMPQDELKEFSQGIYDSAEKMFTLIANLLSVNAIERGAVHLDIQPVPVTGIVQHLVSEYRQRAEAKNITLNLNAPAPEATALCDETALVQVLDNLVSNAVKYSPHGKNVYISIEQTAQSAPNAQSAEHHDGEYIRISIRDEGPGFSDEDKTRLFGKFAKLSAKPTGNEHSTGLGLSIVKKMMDAMGGDVWCESSAGAGATFVLSFKSA